jgi:hypothetical protein
VTASEIVRVIEEMLREPVFFRDVLERLEGERYRLVVRAWGEVRETHPLARDELGRYVMAERSSRRS